MDPSAEFTCLLLSKRKVKTAEMQRGLTERQHDITAVGVSVTTLKEPIIPGKYHFSRVVLTVMCLHPVVCCRKSAICDVTNGDFNKHDQAVALQMICCLLGSLMITTIRIESGGKGFSISYILLHS